MTNTNFKHSGVEWLGQIPKHWEIVPLRAIYKKFDKRCGNENFELLSVTIEKGIIKQSEVEIKQDISNDDKSKYKIVPLNAVAYNKMRMWQGAVGMNEICEGIVSPAYIVAYPTTNFCYKFFAYLFRANFMLLAYNKFSYGICQDQNTLRADDFLSLKIPLPPLNEQRQIAEFLDKKGEKISEFIAKKQRLITLLKEQKQTLINECVCGRLDFVIESERSEVSPSLRDFATQNRGNPQKTTTKGIDCHEVVPTSRNDKIAFKHSGVEWLGQIPKHWEVRKLKTFAKVVLGKMLCSESKQGYTHEHYLKSKNIQWLSVDTTSIEKMYFSNSEKKLYKIQKNDLLVSEGGEVGKTCIWQNELTECYLQNSVHKVTFNNNYNPRYFLYLFFAYGQVGEFDSSVSRVSIAHLTWDILINIKFIVPPLNEQRQIAEFLDKKCEKIDKAIRLVEQEINKMKEYKTSLIDKAVKGQINA